MVGVRVVIGLLGLGHVVLGGGWIVGVFCVGVGVVLCFWIVWIRFIVMVISSILILVLASFEVIVLPVVGIGIWVCAVSFHRELLLVQL